MRVLWCGPWITWSERKVIGPPRSAASLRNAAQIPAIVATHSVPVVIDVGLDIGLISAHAAPGADGGIVLGLGRASRSFARTISRSPSARDR